MIDFLKLSRPDLAQRYAKKVGNWGRLYPSDCLTLIGIARSGVPIFREVSAEGIYKFIQPICESELEHVKVILPDGRFIFDDQYSEEGDALAYKLIKSFLNLALIVRDVKAISNMNSLLRHCNCIYIDRKRQLAIVSEENNDSRSKLWKIAIERGGILVINKLEQI